MWPRFPLFRHITHLIPLLSVTHHFQLLGRNKKKYINNLFVGCIRPQINGGYKDHLQRQQAQGHIWSFYWAQALLPFPVSPLRLSYFQVFVSYCWKSMKWIFKIRWALKRNEPPLQKKRHANSSYWTREQRREDNLYKCIFLTVMWVNVTMANKMRRIPKQFLLGMMSVPPQSKDMHFV